MRRVVVTGMGIVSPLGLGLEHNWAAITAGKSGLRKIRSFDASDLPSQIAGEVPLIGEAEGAAGALDIFKYIEHKEQKKMDRFIHFGLVAGVDAVEDSGWKPTDYEEQCRTGVLIGSGIGGLQNIQDTTILVQEKGPRRISPFFIPSALINLISGHVSIRYGFKGPNHAVVTACATGSHAIGDAARLIMMDDADVMVAGGAEAAICRIGVGGFAAHSRPVLTTHRKRRRVHSTRGVTASSSAKAQVVWCSKNMNTPRSAARRFTAKLSATDYPAMHTTSPLPPKTAMAVSAP